MTATASSAECGQGGGRRRDARLPPASADNAARRDQSTPIRQCCDSLSPSAPFFNCSFTGSFFFFFCSLFYCLFLFVSSFLFFFLIFITDRVATKKLSRKCSRLVKCSLSFKHFTEFLSSSSNKDIFFTIVFSDFYGVLFFVLYSVVTEFWWGI